jgi:hypothetical protein
MLVALQLVGVAAVPLKVTVLVDCVAPKFEPVIVTGVPTGPEVGLKLVMIGAGTIIEADKLNTVFPPRAIGLGSAGPKELTMK